MDHSELLHNFPTCKINTCFSYKFRKLKQRDYNLIIQRKQLLKYFEHFLYILHIIELMSNIKQLGSIFIDQLFVFEILSSFPLPTWNFNIFSNSHLTVQWFQAEGRVRNFIPAFVFSALCNIFITFSIHFWPLSSRLTVADTKKTKKQKTAYNIFSKFKNMT